MTVEKCQEDGALQLSHRGTLDLVRSELRQHVEAVRAAVGRAVGGLLDTGRELIALKAACRHGEWGSAVQATGVHERTAQRLMRAWHEYEERGALANPPTVTALLESAREGKPDTLSDMAELGRLHRAAWHGRSVAIDEGNVERLAWLMRRGVDVGPVLVRRSDGAVVDGWHRVVAARVCGATAIAVDWFDGDNEAAAVECMRRNATHGLPYETEVMETHAEPYPGRRSSRTGHPQRLFTTRVPVHTPPRPAARLAELPRRSKG